MTNIFDEIQKIINSNDIVLFMKGTPDAPCCGFSSFVSGILKNMQVDFIGIDVLENNAVREGIKKFSNWPTIPQLYIKGEFIGGCDITKEMYQTGELQSLFDKYGIKYYSLTKIDQS